MAILVVASACSNSEFRYVSNSSINTYLKVPSEWKEYTNDDLIDAAIVAAQNPDQPGSLIDVLASSQSQWRMAFDASPRPSIDNALNLLVDEPVVNVSVRALGADEHDQMSLAVLRNVIIPYDQLKGAGAENVARRNLGLGGEATESFRPIDEEELNYPDGIRGVRVRYVLRPDASSPFYAFDQTTLVDSKAERLYVLLIRSGEAQFLRNNQLFTKIAKSFTVKPKG